MPTRNIGLSIDEKLFKEIEQIRGITDRSSFMDVLLRRGLEEYKREKKAKE
jgi:metal-responsive CopG/Arc/MetJ family transcriptional regulator